MGGPKMRFSSYTRGSIVAFDDAGNVALRTVHGGGLLCTRDGVPRVVIQRADVPDLKVILECIVRNDPRHACEALDVEVTE